MIRTQVYIPDDLYMQAKIEAEASGESISVVLREGLTRGLKERQKKHKAGKISLADAAGRFSFSAKTTNAAETHNDIYDI